MNIIEVFFMAAIRNEKPFFSVIVPVYNVGKYLDKTIDSVIKQSFSDWELLLIEDSSADNSDEIIKKYVKQDSRIYGYRNLTNQGVSYTRNKGITLSNGKCIVFLDGDDKLDDHLLEKVFNYFQKHQSVDIIGFNFNIFSDDRALNSSEKRFLSRDLIEATYSREESLDQLFNDKLSHLVYLYITKKEIFSKNKIIFPVDLEYSEDMSVVYRLFASASVIHVFSDRFYFYRQRDNSVIHRPKKKHALDILQTVHELDMFADRNFPNLKTKVFMYEIPKLINAYSIYAKSSGNTNDSRYILKSIKKEIKFKLLRVGTLDFLSQRDKIKYFFIKMGLLNMLYKMKRGI